MTEWAKRFWSRPGIIVAVIAAFAALGVFAIESVPQWQQLELPTYLPASPKTATRLPRPTTSASEYMALLDNRAKDIDARLTEVSGDKDASPFTKGALLAYQEEFHDLHERNRQAIQAHRLIVSHDITTEIHRVLGRIDDAIHPLHGEGVPIHPSYEPAYPFWH